jgi:hypothetical protein
MVRGEFESSVVRENNNIGHALDRIFGDNINHHVWRAFAINLL